MAENDKDQKANEEAWKDFVRKGMNDLLDKFLDISDAAHYNIMYVNPTKHKFETHTEYDKDKANGVMLTFRLGFEEIIDIPKDEED